MGNNEVQSRKASKKYAKCGQTRITVQPGVKTYKTMQLRGTHAKLCKKRKNTEIVANMYQTRKHMHECTKHKK